MPIKNGRNCDIYIGGKRISTMREIARATFEDSFLSIEISENRVFVLRIDNKRMDKIDRFTQKHPLCRVVVYQEIPYSKIKH